MHTSNALPARGSSYLAYGLTGVLVLYSFANVARALLAPTAFSGAMGLPTSPDNAFVPVYAIRTGFIALFALFLLIRRDAAKLSAFAGMTVLMPIADAVLVGASGADTKYVVKHVVIAAFLAVTAALLARSSREGSER